MLVTLVLLTFLTIGWVSANDNTTLTEDKGYKNIHTTEEVVYTLGILKTIYLMHMMYWI